MMHQPFCLSASSTVSVLGTGVCMSASNHKTALRKGACAAIAANYTIIPPDGPAPLQAQLCSGWNPNYAGPQPAMR